MKARRNNGVPSSDGLEAVTEKGRIIEDALTWRYNGNAVCEVLAMTEPWHLPVEDWLASERKAELIVEEIRHKRQEAQRLLAEEGWEEAATRYAQ